MNCEDCPNYDPLGCTIDQGGDMDHLTIRHKSGFTGMLNDLGQLIIYKQDIVDCKRWKE